MHCYFLKYIVRTTSWRHDRHSAVQISRWKVVANSAQVSETFIRVSVSSEEYIYTLKRSSLVISVRFYRYVPFALRNVAFPLKLCLFYDPRNNVAFARTPHTIPHLIYLCSSENIIIFLRVLWKAKFKK